MEEIIVEIGMKLNHKFNYYKKILNKHGLRQVFKCKTHDLYFTKEKSFDGFTEYQIKSSCIRIRNPKKNDEIKIHNLLNEGYFKVFDTTKKDYHFSNSVMKSRVQLQKIKNVGLIVYYDNPDYYKFPIDKQRQMLLRELNSYGFTFKMEELGIDKLRTLYYKKEMVSKNQNG